MKRCFAVSGILACVIVLALASAAMADVRGTHHDMNTFVGTNKDTCYPCHGYQDLTFDSTLGKVGSLCYARCHVGGAGAIPTNLAIHTYAPKYGTWADNTMTPALPGGFTPSDKYVAHGFLKSNLPGSDNALVGSWPAWPYLASARMECTSCHDVHTNTFTPFLRAALSDNTANSFCMQCHRAGAVGGATGQRWTIMAANQVPNGGHPVEVGAGGQAWASDLQRKGRAIALKDVYVGTDNAVFRNRTAAQANMGVPTNHFNPGGKLGNATQTGDSGNVGCYTCHATHMPASAGMDQFTVAPWKMSGSTRTRSVMCIGCHGATATDGRNPGTTAYYHPNNGETRYVSGIGTPSSVEYTTTTPGTGFSIWVNLTGTDYAPTGQISCSSCHGDTASGSHRGVHDLENGKLLINPQKPACSSCHDGTTHAVYQIGNGAVHHPIGGTSAEAAQWATNGFRPFFRWNANDNMVLSDGLGCGDCHTFNGTAHNWN